LLLNQEMQLIYLLNRIDTNIKDKLVEKHHYIDDIGDDILNKL